MSTIEAKPLTTAARIALFMAAGMSLQEGGIHLRGDQVAQALTDAVEAIQWLEQREAHVIAQLRQATKCGGGYGFAAALLRYLGADQEVQE